MRAKENIGLLDVLNGGNMDKAKLEAGRTFRTRKGTI
jgi:hypothetical protein